MTATRVVVLAGGAWLALVGLAWLLVRGGTRRPDPPVDLDERLERALLDEHLAGHHAPTYDVGDCPVCRAIIRRAFERLNQTLRDDRRRP